MKSATERADQRISFVAWALLWGFAPAAAAVFLFYDVVDPLAGQMLGRDFSNLWFAGRLALDGNVACAFDVECFRSAIADSLGVTAAQNYSYPPHALFIALLFATLLITLR